ncbi:AEC family transporter [Rurimicrobium arvi]|uniref:AEC family transporter n=1 Tax=Rurimicrobium arvi TaxID=2049916 RepID=A0ABP8MT64_9BACT
MINFILIALCLSLGVFFRRSGKVPKDAHRGINAWLINVGLPAVSFKYLPSVFFTRDLLMPALAPVLVWAMGWMYVRIYTSRHPLSRPASGGLQLSSSLSNTSFVGFPLIMAYFSEEAIGVGIICDQVTFLLLSTVGIMTAMRAAPGHAWSLSSLVRRLLSFPPVWGCALALLLPRLIDIRPVYPLANALAATVAPLALFSIGLQLRLDGWRSELKRIRVALLYKLLLAPAIVLLFAVVCGFKGLPARIAVFEAAMPTLLTSGIIADQYELDPRMVNLTIGISILLSLVTTWIWYTVISIPGLL